MSYRYVRHPELDEDGLIAYTCNELLGNEVKE